MGTRVLRRVGRVYCYVEGKVRCDAFVYIDTEPLEYFVVEGRESPGDGRTESAPVPVDRYMKVHPEWAEAVRQAMLE